jgi:hypothetical protein
MVICHDRGSFDLLVRELGRVELLEGEFGDPDTVGDVFIFANFFGWVLICRCRLLHICLRSGSRQVGLSVLVINHAR